MNAATWKDWRELWTLYTHIWSQLTKQFAKQAAKDAALANILETECSATALEGDEADEVTCVRCGKTFNSQVAASVHDQWVHGRKAEMKEYLSSSACPVCGKAIPHQCLGRTFAKALLASKQSKRGRLRK